MSGGPPEVTTPPEVPDEFAAAYREAYERALLEQTDAPRHRHRRPPPTAPAAPTADLDLPERPGRLVVGTHRQEAVTEDTWFDHVRDNRLFVPALLAALALLLVLGAYVLGRAFTAAVGG